MDYFVGGQGWRDPGRFASPCRMASNQLPKTKFHRRWIQSNIDIEVSVTGFRLEKQDELTNIVS